MANGLSPKRFYANERLNVKLLTREKELKKYLGPTTFRPCFTDEVLKCCWEVFRYQKDALGFQKQMIGVHVFSFESNSFQENSGQRLFLVASYQEFWHYYIQLKDELRIHYELIPENSPCHLYFDIEFDYDLNPGKDGSEMIEVFIKFVCLCLQTQGVECSKDDCLILESNSPVKFSRHIILHLPNNMVFENNLEAGNFARYIHHTYLSELFDDGFLLVNIHSGKKDLFCDMGVYSKNRNFRLFLSSKRGKGFPFQIANENSYRGVDCRSQKEVFMAALVCNVSKNSMRFGFGTDGLRTSNEYSYKENHTHSKHWKNITNENMIFSYNHPTRLDDFVTSLIQIGGVEGKIYKKMLKKEEGIVVYDIIKNRWCRNVDRFHKSNNVRILVNMKRNVWYQKCHDPDCRSYKSQDFLIPNNVQLKEELILAGLDQSESFLSEEDFDAIFSDSNEPTEGNTDDSNLKIDINHEALIDVLNHELTENDDSNRDEDMFDVSDDDLLNIRLT